jgi:hypothetical protein
MLVNKSRRARVFKGFDTFGLLWQVARIVYKTTR